jgi:Rieske Fe-S protein
VLAIGLKKVAVYKNASGNLSGYSAICPHLGCILQWNGIERSFDCPCHGSRFTCESKVINGPAHTDLKKVEITEKMKA